MVFIRKEKDNSFNKITDIGHLNIIKAFLFIYS